MKKYLADFSVVGVLIGASLVVTFMLMKPNTTIEDFAKQTDLAKASADARRLEDNRQVKTNVFTESTRLPTIKNVLSEETYTWQQLLLRDSIVPIYDPTFVVGETALLESRELVIGVAINGEAKAYPIGPLNGREMVNDVVGGVPVLVTW